MADSFAPMGLRQQDLKKMVFYNVRPKKNWTDSIKIALKIRGQAQFCTRFIWHGLPDGIDSQQLERMLYFRGLLGMFYDPDFGFVILPAIQQSRKKDNSIGFMGRWKYARAVPFNGPGDEKRESSEDKITKLTLATMGDKKVLWDIPFIKDDENYKEIALELMKDSCVLLYDYTPQIAEIPLARHILEDPFYDGEVELIKMIRTASLNSTGVQWVRVTNEAEAEVLQEQFKVYDQLILEGQRYIAISAMTDIQEGSTLSSAQMQEFWASWQSLENLRQSCIGLSNDGMQQKSQYQNIQEQALDNVGNNPVLLDAWLQRVKFCSIANALWGLSMGVEVAGMDTNGTNEQQQSESADDGREGETSNETN